MKKKAIKIETYLRLAAQIAAYVAAGVAQFGFQDDVAGKYVCFACALVVTAYNFWKNNSFTQAAIAADEILKQIKDGELIVEDVEE